MAAIVLTVLTLQSVQAGLDDCGSTEFRREFLDGSPMERAEGPRCGLTSPNPNLVAAGDRVLPCLEAVVHGKGAKIPECHGQPSRCRNWAMGAIAAIRTPRAAAFLMSVAGGTNDTDLLIGAAHGLANMQARQAIPVLVARLDSDRDRVRAELVASLGVLAAREHTRELLEATLRLKPEDFHRAIHGFRFMADPSVVPALRTYVNALPPSGIRNVLSDTVTDIGMVANLRAGVEQSDRGNIASAESFLRAAIAEGEGSKRSDPTLAEAYVELGDLFRRRGRLDEAVALLARAADVSRTVLALGDGRRLDLEIARALASDARGMDTALADKFAHVARLLLAADAARRREVDSRFPELNGVFERYAAYCRSHKLLACQQDVERFLSGRQEDAAPPSEVGK